MEDRGYLRKRAAAFSYAFKGVYRLIRHEAHALIHLIAAACVVAAGFVWKISAIEWCMVIICIGMVFSAEGFNTAIEKLADRISLQHSPLIGAAKDIAAGAVLFTAIASLIVGLIIFLPKIFHS